MRTGHATDVEASFGLKKDPYLFWMEASLRPGVEHAAAERAIAAELARMASEPMSAEEFARVRRGVLAGTAYPSDTVTGRAFRLGQLLATGAAASIGEWYERLVAVTAEDVRAAAEATFVERSRNVGWFVPQA